MKICHFIFCCQCCRFLTFVNKYIVDKITLFLHQQKIPQKFHFTIFIFRSIPDYFLQLKYISWFKYSYEALQINQWDGIDSIGEFQ